MKVEYYFELSCHSIIAVTHLYSYNCHNFIWCAVSLWCVSSTSLALRYLLYIERALWKSIQRHKWHLWKWSRDTLMIFWLRLVVITLYLWMISYWCIPMLWHCLGWFKVRRKWELWTKGRPKLQYHAGCIAHFSFMNRIPNTTKQIATMCLQRTTCLYMFISTQCLYVCFSVWLSQLFCSNISPSLSRELTNESSYIRGRSWSDSQRHIIAMVICYAILFVLVIWRNVTQL